ncbi:MAG: histone deacetylase family protein [Thermodesulfobacteriota bacterium]
MKIVWSEKLREPYDTDPAAALGRLDPAVEALAGWAEWVEPVPAREEDLLRCHTRRHLEEVRREGLYAAAALAAGGAILAARLAQEAPSFALVRPPGHHASRDRAWGFCHLNNLAVALAERWAAGRVQQALVLDVDVHFGDGTADVLGGEGWVRIVNPGAPSRQEYLRQVIEALEEFAGDWIAVSAGFDHHSLDWGGLLHTEDYELIGLRVGIRARALGGHAFGVLEGGYNPRSLAESLRAFCHGLERGWEKGASGRADRA